jgi:hypothetical protein
VTQVDRKDGGGSRKKRVSEGPAAGGGVYRRGEAVKPQGGKPVGKTDGYAERKQGSSAPIGSQQDMGQFGSGSNGSSGKPPYTQRQGPTGGGGISPKKLLFLIIILFVGYLLLRSCSGMLAEPEVPASQGFTAEAPSASVVSGDPANNNISPMTGITGPRTRRTEILGGGRDVFTIMIYMCGTDLESQHGMGTADLNEMLHATISDKVNIIVETGGTARWRNSVVKNNTNQRYQVTPSGLRLLQDNLGQRPMTDPRTLEDFITYSASNFPANRYALIFWDHGGGSLSGFGYDQLFPNSGSMSISQIHSALEGAGVKFDFVGFDACLMATLETAYMLNYHADYMIASEETEPGIGWYYTNWISKLSANTSMDTVEIGKLIIDDFTATCRQTVPREITTLSIIDLVVLNNEVDEPFKKFAAAVDEQLDSDYRIVSNARGDSREFNRSNLDQVDLIDLAQNIGSPEALALVGALQQAIRYNRTSDNISRAHGVSIYFPYDELRNMSSMVNIYDQIGMGDEYTTLVRKFANMVVGGQITTSGSSNPLGSLLGASGGGGSPGSSADLWSLAWNTFFTDADFGSVIGALSGEQTNWIDPNLIQSNADYYREHYLDAGSLQLIRKGGGHVLKLTDEQWELIQKVELNVFFDDGSGFIDLGLDNVYEFDSDGDLIVDFDGTWLALDRQIVAYYVESIEEDGSYWSITGRIPAMLNGELVDIIVMFNNEYPYGTVAGARINYGALTDTAAKGLIPLESGDVIDFLCDYYTYDEEYDSSYYLGNQMIVDGELEVSNVDVGSARCMVTYRLTDIYNNTYWTPALIYNQ